MTACTRIACARSPFGRVAAFLRLRALTLLPLGLLLQGDTLEGYIIQTEELRIGAQAYTRPHNMRHGTKLFLWSSSLTAELWSETTQAAELNGFTASDQSTCCIGSKIEDRCHLHIVEGRVPCYHIAEAIKGYASTRMSCCDRNLLTGKLAEFHFGSTECVTESLLCGSHNRVQIKSE